MSKARVATTWLEGCSGCHMSFLDMDQLIIDLADKIELVYSPLVDAKEFPHDVDVTLIEGGVGNHEQAELLKTIRARTKVLVALGDCAVTGNVPSMRNPFSVQEVLDRAYVENTAMHPQVPDQVVPALIPHVLPLHHVVKVDEYILGCAPSAQLIHFILVELLAGRIPGLGVRARFG